MTMSDIQEQYNNLMPENLSFLMQCHSAAKGFEELINSLTNRRNSREMQLAVINLQQALMWTMQGIVLFDEMIKNLKSKDQNDERY